MIQTTRQTCEMFSQYLPPGGCRQGVAVVARSSDPTETFKITLTYKTAAGETLTESRKPITSGVTSAFFLDDVTVLSTTAKSLKTGDSASYPPLTK